jgi:F0F1-type ATP synthase assembly protein I
MANASALNVPNPIDVVSSKLNFIQQIIVTLIKSIVNIVLSPKVILTFVLNYKIVYGPQATFTNGVDFIKKNKNLMNRIMKVIAEELIKILLAIALKEIAILVSKAMAKKQKEKVTLKLAQLQSLIGVPTNIIQQLLGNLI